MAQSKHRQSHYFEILNLFGLAAIVMTSLTLQDQMNAFVVTLMTVTYFIANILYSAKTHTLDAARVLEIGAIAVICEFIILNYVI